MLCVQGAGTDSVGTELSTVVTKGCQVLGRGPAACAAWKTEMGRNAEPRNPEVSEPGGAAETNPMGTWAAALPPGPLKRGSQEAVGVGG